MARRRVARDSFLPVQAAVVALVMAHQRPVL